MPAADVADDNADRYVHRQVVLDLCEALGVDPNRVDRIVVEPTGVIIQYRRHVVDAYARSAVQPFE